MPRKRVSGRASLEPLERRRLLAQLVIDGTSSNDTITLSINAGNIVVNLNGTISTRDDNTVTTITINALDGDDTINIEGNSNNPITINAGAGADVCLLTSSNQNLNNIASELAFVGGDGSDALVAFDSNRSADDAWVISSTMFSRDGLSTIQYESETLRIYQGTGDNHTIVSDFSNPSLIIDCWEGNDRVELHQIGADAHVELTGYTGDDWFFVESSAATTQIDIAGEVGVNEVSIASQSRDASMVAGEVNFVGSGSGDSLRIFDDGRQIQTYYLLATDTISADFMGFIMFADVTTVELYGALGGGYFRFDGTALGTTTQITPGDLDDTFNITPIGDISAIQGEIIIEDSTGTDSLLVFDDQTNSIGNYDFSDVKLTGVAFADISYSVEKIDLYCSSGDNGIVVRNQNGNVKQRFFAGEGVDVIDIHESVSIIDFDTGPGIDRLVLNEDGGAPAFARIIANDTINTVNVGPNSILTLADNITLRATNENLEGAMAFGHHSSYIAAAGTAALPIGIARNYVFAGYNGGNWLGTFAAFRSDFSNASPARDGIGYARAADIGLTEFKNIPVTPDDIIFTQTLYGDADLNYTVNFNDLLRVAQNYSLGMRYWSQGDFDYDRSVLFPDLLLIAQNYGLSAMSFTKSSAPNRITRIVLIDSPPINSSSQSRID